LKDYFLATAYLYEFLRNSLLALYGRDILLVGVNTLWKNDLRFHPSLSYFVVALLLLSLNTKARAQSAQVESDVSAGGSADKASAPSEPDEQILQELDRMRARIAELENRLRQRSGASAASSGNEGTHPSEVVGSISAPPVPVAVSSSAHVEQGETSVPPAKPAKAEPFAFADWTWLNGNPRTKEPAFDSKFFTPEVRVDVAYHYDFNHPKDDTIGGSSEVFRSNEVALTHLGIGGDFHYDHVRARVFTQLGQYATATPRNDASYSRGQWQLDNAYRYLNEAYGGYHFDALHGINVDAGIFLSYVGLFSFYQFDNWAYQPSYVSSNTPWFFTGMRVQIFPTEKLKIEPWIINGWQTYARPNGRLGLGGKILWRPTPWLSVISNNYGIGTYALGIPNHCTRYHTDDSVEVILRPSRTLFVKMAFSLLVTWVANPAAASIAPRIRRTLLAASSITSRASSASCCTTGGGSIGTATHSRWAAAEINNPGRYLVLLPPINGATATTGTYFTENPGDQFKAWDISGTYDYMPSQYITFRWEFNHRHANVPYWSGPGGVTPPGGNNGVPGTTIPGWSPDLRKTEDRATMGILVKF
jgi:hypothetical protein